VFFKKKKNSSFISGADETMEAAINTARDKFDEFWQAKDQKAQTCEDFAVKIALKHQDAEVEVEHIWVGDPEKNGGLYSGILAADSFYSKTLCEGSSVNFTADDVSDWQYIDSGKAVGHFTTKVLMRDMSKSERRSVARSLGWTI